MKRLPFWLCGENCLEGELFLFIFLEDKDINNFPYLCPPLLHNLRNSQAMTTSEKFILKWNDFKDNVTTAFGSLRDDNNFSDVTLACEDFFFLHVRMDKRLRHKSHPGSLQSILPEPTEQEQASTSTYIHEGG